MLCLSAALAVSCCLSVRLLTLVYCIETAEDTFKQFSQPDSPIILVFEPKQRYTISTRTPQRGHDIDVGSERNRIFRLISRCIVETVQDKRMVTVER